VWWHPRGGESRELVLASPGSALTDPPERDPFADHEPWDGDLLEEEEEPEQPEAPPLSDHGGGKLAGLVMAGALVVAYLATGSRAEDGEAFRAGAADAARILAGEPWRAVTALTLHADLSHLVANVTAGAFLATAVCRTLGGGLGAILIVVAGAAGNLLNAVLRGPPHVSVGASTAVLGAVGLLSGLAFARVRRRTGRARAWLPLAAGLALLGMLGSDPRSDLGAHLCGFAVGVGLGAFCGWLLVRVPGLGAQRALATGALVAVAASWWLALHA
jgi:membrane associated rhomboid family serine protease